MVNHAQLEHSLVIWDNGSHPQVEEWIRDEMKPDLYIDSFNFGKNSARTSLMRMIPPHHLVCYSDDDMYFYPGWLKPQIELLEGFPNVACVSGYPARTSQRWGNKNTLTWAEANAKVTRGRMMPQQWEDDFAVSIGRDVEKHKEDSKNDNDILIEYKGKQAYATSHHCQFIARSEVAARILTYDLAAMQPERPFDDAMDMVGLRLATTQRYARHIGNIIHDELRKEIQTAELVTA